MKIRIDILLTVNQGFGDTQHIWVLPDFIHQQYVPNKFKEVLKFSRVIFFPVIYPPRKLLTCPQKGDHSKRNFIFQPSIFGRYVSFKGGTT